jgi:hypothetical protein
MRQQHRRQQLDGARAHTAARSNCSSSAASANRQANGKLGGAVFRIPGMPCQGQAEFRSRI